MNMTSIELLFLFLATVFGAVVTSGLGWLDSGTPFELRKFVPGLIRGIIAAIIVFVASYSGFVGEISLFTYLGAFLAGGGFDTMVNRLTGISGIGQEKPPT
jgi:hypothetical protein